MTSHSEQLEELIDALALEGDPRRRERHLIEAASLATGAGEIALWRIDPQGCWRRQVSRGSAQGGPDSRQVAAVAAVQLPPILPPARLVAHLGEVALGVGALPPGRDPEELLDALEALLFTFVLVDEGEEGASPLDLLHPALPGPEVPPGTHTPPTADLADLRHLLEHLAHEQSRLAQSRLEELEERERVLEQGAEQAADLLLRSAGYRTEGAAAATLHGALFALGDAAPSEEHLHIRGDADQRRLSLEPGALLSLLLLLTRIAPQAGPLHLSVSILDDELCLCAEREEWPRYDLPGESSFRELRERCTVHGAKLRLEEGALRVYLPLLRFPGQRAA